MSARVRARDCNARDRRRLRRRARAVLFGGKALTDRKPIGRCGRIGRRAVGRRGGSRTFQRAGLAVERPGSVNIDSTVGVRQNAPHAAGGHLNIAQIMRGQRPPRPQARTVGGVRAHEPRSITRSRVYRWLLLTRPTAHNPLRYVSVPAQSPQSWGMGVNNSGARARAGAHGLSAGSTSSSSHASASKAASNASALTGSVEDSADDTSAAVSGTILSVDRTLPGCVAVWIALSLRIETWV